MRFLRMTASIDEIWLFALRGLLSQNPIGSRVGGMREQLGFGFVLTNTDDSLLRNKRRALSPIYGCAEFLWYLSRTADATMIRAYAPQYEKFVDDAGQAYGSYGARLDTQLDEIVEELKVHDHSRQCVLGMWRREDLAAVRQGSCRDIPCTLSWQFFLRNGQLHMHTHMRSNDIWLGLPYDVFVNVNVLRLLAHQLRVPVGEYIHTVGSIHLYERNVAAAREAVESAYEMYRMPLQFDIYDRAPMLWGAVETSLYAEHQVRCGRPVPGELDNIPQPLRDIVLTACHKWSPCIENIASPLIKEILYADR